MYVCVCAHTRTERETDKETETERNNVYILPEEGVLNLIFNYSMIFNQLFNDPSAAPTTVPGTASISSVQEFVKTEGPRAPPPTAAKFAG